MTAKDWRDAFIARHAGDTSQMRAAFDGVVGATPSVQIDWSTAERGAAGIFAWVVQHTSSGGAALRMLRDLSGGAAQCMCGGM